MPWSAFGASWVLGKGRLSRSVIREEDPGHAEDGREGGVHAVGCGCDFRRLKRSRALLYHRAYSISTVFQSQKLNQTPQKRKKKKRRTRTQKDTTQTKKAHSPQKAQAKGQAGLLPSILKADRRGRCIPCHADMEEELIRCVAAPATKTTFYRVHFSYLS